VKNGTETGVDCGGSCSACAAPVPGFQMANNEVVMLATSRTSTSTVGTDSFTVSGSDMQCTVDSGDAWTTAGAGPKVTFNVNFTSTGAFYVHLYGDGPNGAGNSAFAGVDGTAMGAFYDFPGTSTNVWRSQGTVNVTTTGAHTVSVWAREDGMKINKIVVNKSATAPTGSGPAQSTKL
jgi:Gylcosyl hydrolase family 115 C-terminal domain